MLLEGKEVLYIKASKHHGIGAIPLGSKGIVLKCVKSNNIVKLLVDFYDFGKVIVPLSSISLVE